MTSNVNLDVLQGANAIVTNSVSTSPALNQTFQNLVLQLETALQNNGSPNVSSIESSLGQLIFYAENGDGSGHYFTSDMVTQLNALLDTFKGVTYNGFPVILAYTAGTSAQNSVVSLNSSSVDVSDQIRDNPSLLWNQWIVDLKFQASQNPDFLTPPFEENFLNFSSVNFPLGTSSVSPATNPTVTNTDSSWVDPTISQLETDLQNVLSQFFWGTYNLSSSATISALGAVGNDLNTLVSNCYSPGASLSQLDKINYILQSYINNSGASSINSSGFGVFDSSDPSNIQNVGNWLQSIIARPDNLSPSLADGVFSVSTLAFSGDAANSLYQLTVGPSNTSIPVVIGNANIPFFNEAQASFSSLIAKLESDQVAVVNGQSGAEANVISDLQSLLSLAQNGSISGGYISQSNLTELNDVFQSLATSGLNVNNLNIGQIDNWLAQNQKYSLVTGPSSAINIVAGNSDMPFFDEAQAAFTTLFNQLVSDQTAVLSGQSGADARVVTDLTNLLNLAQNGSASGGHISKTNLDTLNSVFQSLALSGISVNSITASNVDNWLAFTLTTGPSTTVRVKSNNPGLPFFNEAQKAFSSDISQLLTDQIAVIQGLSGAAAKVVSDLRTLLNLAQNGSPSGGYLSQLNLQALNSIFQSLSSSGDSVSNVTTAQVSSWLASQNPPFSLTIGPSVTTSVITGNSSLPYSSEAHAEFIALFKQLESDQAAFVTGQSSADASVISDINALLNLAQNGRVNGGFISQSDLTRLNTVFQSIANSGFSVDSLTTTQIDSWLTQTISASSIVTGPSSTATVIIGTSSTPFFNEAQSAFSTYMNQLAIDQTAVIKGQSGSDTNVVADLAALLNLAQNGSASGGHISQSNLQSLNTIFQSLAASGYSVNTVSPAQVDNWLNLNNSIFSLTSGPSATISVIAGNSDMPFYAIAQQNFNTYMSNLAADQTAFINETPGADQSIANDITSLYNLAQNSNTLGGYLSLGNLTQLNAIFQSLANSGFSVSSLTADQVDAWLSQNKSVFTLTPGTASANINLDVLPGATAIVTNSVSTSPALNQTFQNLVLQLETALQNNGSSSVSTIESSLGQLIFYAQNGDGSGHYYTSNMVAQLNALLDSFKGVTYNGFPVTLAYTAGTSAQNSVVSLNSSVDLSDQLRDDPSLLWNQWIVDVKFQSSLNPDFLSPPFIENFLNSSSVNFNLGTSAVSPATNPTVTNTNSAWVDPTLNQLGTDLQKVLSIYFWGNYNLSSSSTLNALTAVGNDLNTLVSNCYSSGASLSQLDKINYILQSYINNSGATSIDSTGFGVFNNTNPTNIQNLDSWLQTLIAQPNDLSPSLADGVFSVSTLAFSGDAANSLFQLTNGPSSAPNTFSTTPVIIGNANIPFFDEAQSGFSSFIAKLESDQVAAVNGQSGAEANVIFDLQSLYNLAQNGSISGGYISQSNLTALNGIFQSLANSGLSVNNLNNAQIDNWLAQNPRFNLVIGPNPSDSINIVAGNPDMPFFDEAQAAFTTYYNQFLSDQNAVLSGQAGADASVATDLQNLLNLALNGSTNGGHISQANLKTLYSVFQSLAISGITVSTVTSTDVDNWLSFNLTIGPNTTIPVKSNNPSLPFFNEAQTAFSADISQLLTDQIAVLNGLSGSESKVISDLTNLLNLAEQGSTNGGHLSQLNLQALNAVFQSLASPPSNLSVGSLQPTDIDNWLAALNPQFTLTIGPSVTTSVITGNTNLPFFSEANSDYHNLISQLENDQIAVVKGQAGAENNVINDLNALLDLAQNGRVTGGFISQANLTALNNVFLSLVNPPNGFSIASLTPSQIDSWLSQSSVFSLITGPNSIQSVVAGTSSMPYFDEAQSTFTTLLNQLTTDQAAVIQSQAGPATVAADLTALLNLAQNGSTNGGHISQSNLQIINTIFNSLANSGFSVSGVKAADVGTWLSQNNSIFALTTGPSATINVLVGNSDMPFFDAAQQNFSLAIGNLDNHLTAFSQHQSGADASIASDLSTLLSLAQNSSGLGGYLSSSNLQTLNTIFKSLASPPTNISISANITSSQVDTWLNFSLTTGPSSTSTVVAGNSAQPGFSNVQTVFSADINQLLKDQVAYINGTSGADTLVVADLLALYNLAQNGSGGANISRDNLNILNAIFQTIAGKNITISNITGPNGATSVDTWLNSLNPLYTLTTGAGPITTSVITGAADLPFFTEAQTQYASLISQLEKDQVGVINGQAGAETSVINDLTALLNLAQNGSTNGGYISKSNLDELNAVLTSLANNGFNVNSLTPDEIDSWLSAGAAGSTFALTVGPSSTITVIPGTPNMPFYDEAQAAFSTLFNKLTADQIGAINGSGSKNNVATDIVNLVNLVENGSTNGGFVSLSNIQALNTILQSLAASGFSVDSLTVDNEIVSNITDWLAQNQLFNLTIGPSAHVQVITGNSDLPNFDVAQQNFATYLNSFAADQFAAIQRQAGSEARVITDLHNLLAVAQNTSGTGGFISQSNLQTLNTIFQSLANTLPAGVTVNNLSTTQIDNWLTSANPSFPLTIGPSATINVIAGNAVMPAFDEALNAFATDLNQLKADVNGVLNGTTGADGSVVNDLTALLNLAKNGSTSRGFISISDLNVLNNIFSSVASVGYNVSTLTAAQAHNWALGNSNIFPTLNTVTIGGQSISEVVSSSAVPSAGLNTSFVSLLNTLESTLQQDSLNSPLQPSNTTYEQTIGALIYLAENGDTQGGYLTQDMVNQLNTVLNIFNNVNGTPIILNYNEGSNSQTSTVTFTDANNESENTILTNLISNLQNSSAQDSSFLSPPFVSGFLNGQVVLTSPNFPGAIFYRLGIFNGFPEFTSVVSSPTGDTNEVKDALNQFQGALQNVLSQVYAGNLVLSDTSSSQTQSAITEVGNALNNLIANVNNHGSLSQLNQVNEIIESLINHSGGASLSLGVNGFGNFDSSSPSNLSAASSWLQSLISNPNSLTPALPFGSLTIAGLGATEGTAISYDLTIAHQDSLPVVIGNSNMPFYAEAQTAFTTDLNTLYSDMSSVANGTVGKDTNLLYDITTLLNLAKNGSASGGYLSQGNLTLLNLVFNSITHQGYNVSALTTDQVHNWALLNNGTLPTLNQFTIAGQAINAVVSPLKFSQISSGGTPIFESLIGALESQVQKDIQTNTVSISSYNSILGQLVYLAQFGDGQGNYLTADMVNQLKTVLNTFNNLNLSVTVNSSVLVLPISLSFSGSSLANSNVSLSATGINTDNSALWNNWLTSVKSLLQTNGSSLTPPFISGFNTDLTAANKYTIGPPGYSVTPTYNSNLDVGFSFFNNSLTLNSSPTVSNDLVTLRNDVESFLFQVYWGGVDIKDIANNPSLLGSTTYSLVSTIGQDIGNLYAHVTNVSGNPSIPQLNNANQLLTAIINSSVNTQYPYIPGFFGSLAQGNQGPTFYAGVLNWINSIVSSPDSVSPALNYGLFTPFLLASLPGASSSSMVTLQNGVSVIKGTPYMAGFDEAQALFEGLINKLKKDKTAVISGSATDTTSVINDILSLINLAENGSPQGGYLSSGNLGVLNSILTSLSASGVSNVSQINQAQASTWVFANYTIPTVQSINVVSQNIYEVSNPTISVSSPLQSSYAQYISQIEANLQIIRNNGGNFGSPNLEFNAESQIKAALGGALYLAQNGDGTGDYLSTDMVNQLNAILGSLNGILSVYPNVTLLYNQGTSDATSTVSLNQPTSIFSFPPDLWQQWASLISSNENALSPPFNPGFFEETNIFTGGSQVTANYNIVTNGQQINITTFNPFKTTTGGLQSQLTRLQTDMQAAAQTLYFGNVDLTNINQNFNPNADTENFINQASQVQSDLSAIITAMTAANLNVSARLSLSDLNLGAQVLISYTNAISTPLNTFNIENAPLDPASIATWLKSFTNANSLSPAFPYGALAPTLFQNTAALFPSATSALFQGTRGGTPVINVVSGTTNLGGFYTDAQNQYNSIVGGLQTLIANIFTNSSATGTPPVINPPLSSLQVAQLQNYLVSLWKLAEQGSTGGGFLSQTNIAQLNNLVVFLKSSLPSSIASQPENFASDGNVVISPTGITVTPKSGQSATIADVMNNFLGALFKNPNALSQTNGGPFTSNSFNISLLQIEQATGASATLPFSIAELSGASSTPITKIPVLLSPVTDSNVTNQFDNALLDIQNILSTSGAAFSSSQLQNDFGVLVNLAINGDGFGHYLTANMVSTLKTLLSSFGSLTHAALNINASPSQFYITGSPNEASAWSNWVNSNASSIYSILPFGVPDSFGRVAFAGGVSVQSTSSPSALTTQAFNSAISSLQTDLQNYEATINWSNSPFTTTLVNNITQDINTIGQLVVAPNQFGQQGALSPSQLQQAAIILNPLLTSNVVSIFTQGGFFGSGNNQEFSVDGNLSGWLSTTLQNNLDVFAPLLPYGFLSPTALVQPGGIVDTGQFFNLGTPYISLITGTSSAIRAPLAPANASTTAAKNQFKSDINKILTLLAEISSTSQGTLGKDPLTGTSQAAQLRSLVTDLINISVDGVNTTYLPQDSLNAINALLNSIISANNTAPATPIFNIQSFTISQCQAWINSLGSSPLNNVYGIISRYSVDFPSSLAPSVPSLLQASGLVPINIGGTNIIVKTSSTETGFSANTSYSIDKTAIETILQAYSQGVPLTQNMAVQLSKAVGELVDNAQNGTLTAAHAADLNTLLTSLSTDFTSRSNPPWTAGSVTYNNDGTVQSTTPANNIFKSGSVPLAQWTKWLNDVTSVTPPTGAALDSYFASGYLAPASVVSSLKAQNLAIVNIAGTQKLVPTTSTSDSTVQADIGKIKLALQEYAAGYLNPPNKTLDFSDFSSGFGPLLSLVQGGNATYNDNIINFFSSTQSSGKISATDMANLVPLFQALSSASTAKGVSNWALTNNALVLKNSSQVDQSQNVLAGALNGIFNSPATTSPGSTTTIDSLISAYYPGYLSGPTLATDLKNNGLPFNNNVNNSVIAPLDIGKTTTPIVITFAGAPSNSSGQMDPKLAASYNSLVGDVEFILQQIYFNKLNGNPIASATELQQLGESISRLVKLAQNGDGNGNYIDITSATKLNNFLSSLSNSLPAGWTASSINTSTIAGGGVITNQQWGAWLNSTVLSATPTNFGGFFPSNYLDQASISQAFSNYVPVQVPFGNATITYFGTKGSMPATMNAQFQTAVAFIEGVVLQYAKGGGTGAPSNAEIALLKQYMGQLVGMAEFGDSQGNRLDGASLTKVSQLFTALVGSNTSTPFTGLFARDSSGNLELNVNNTETAITTAQWQNFLTYASNPGNVGSLVGVFPSDYLNAPIPLLTLAFGGNNAIVPANFTGGDADDTLTNAYQSYVNDIQNILTSPSSKSSFSSDQINSLNKDAASLINLAIAGYNGSFLNVQMVQNIGLLTDALVAAGVTDFSNKAIDSTSIPPTYQLTNTTSSNWQIFHDLVVSTNILQPMFAPATSVNPNISIQAMVELDYVKLGNDMLSTNLSNLQNALNTTNTVLKTLTSLQNIHNTLVVTTREPFSSFFPNLGHISAYGTGAGASVAYQAAYSTAATAYFNQPLYPTVPGLTPALPPGADRWHTVNVPAGAQALGVQQDAPYIVAGGQDNHTRLTGWINNYGNMLKSGNILGNMFASSPALQNLALNFTTDSKTQPIFTMHVDGGGIGTMQLATFNGFFPTTLGGGGNTLLSARVTDLNGNSTGLGQGNNIVMFVPPGQTLSQDFLNSYKDSNGNTMIHGSQSVKLTAYNSDGSANNSFSTTATMYWFTDRSTAGSGVNNIEGQLINDAATFQQLSNGNNTGY